MKLLRCIQHAFEMVLHSKLRSWLTIIGIVIGVASVIAIVSLGTGLKSTLTSQLTLGGDLLTLTAGAPRGGSNFGPGGGGFDVGGGSSGATTTSIVLDKSDYQVLRGISDIALIDTNIRGSAKVTYLDKTGSVSITGVDQKVWSQITTSKIAEGRMLDAADQNVVVIGGRLASNYFSQPLGVNKVISINGSAFRIVGILNDSSTNVYMPLSMAYQILTTKERDVYDTIVVKVKNEDQLDVAILKIEERLMLARHVTSKKMDFSVNSNKENQAARTQALSSLSMFLVALAGVSLLVGAVGIANTMFTSVLEKTKEIGIMKAIGARNKDILLIFLFNAAFIGLVGGIIGIIVGMILSGVMTTLIGGSLPVGRGGLTAIVSLSSIFMAVGVSVLSGLIAGSIPAYQASKLKPVDALRFE